MILEMNGFEIDSYNDPLLALSNFKPDLYGLALLDIRMPKMNGFELYKKIKDIDNIIQVCFITAKRYRRSSKTCSNNSGISLLVDYYEDD